MDDAHFSVEDRFKHFFKPEVRKAADDLIRKKAVFMQIGSDTQVGASVRGTTPAKVAFRSVSISSPAISVSCSCKAFAKGQFCKHIWAVLVLSSSSDFFAEKTEIHREEILAEQLTPARAGAAAFQEQQKVRAAPFKQAAKDRAKAYRDEAKERAKSYRDEAKERAKSYREEDRANSAARSAGKASSKSTIGARGMPDAAKAALSYFEANGFPLEWPVDSAAVDNAKRVLSRVFHPDKGGTAAEMHELLQHAETLLKFRV